MIIFIEMVMLISKIAVFGLQKIQEWILRNFYISLVLLFGALLVWRSDERSHYFVNRAGYSVTVNGLRYRDMFTNYFQLVIDNIDVSFKAVLIGWRHMPHRQRNIKFIANKISWSNKFAWSNAVRVFFVQLCKRLSLCR